MQRLGQPETRRHSTTRHYVALVGEVGRPSLASAGTVRRAVAGDGGLLAELRWSWRTEEGDEIGTEKAEFSAAFCRWLADRAKTHAAFLAEWSRAAVGMAWLATVERVPGPGVWRRLAGNLQSVYVLPEYRNRGLGAALVLAALEEAVSLGFDYVYVHPSTKAVPLYRRLGFEQSDGLLQVDFTSWSVPE